jgi:hypothetical protein
MTENWNKKIEIKTWLKIETEVQILLCNLCVQWLPICNNLYIVGETTNMLDLGRYSNPKVKSN